MDVPPNNKNAIKVPDTKLKQEQSNSLRNLQVPKRNESSNILIDGDYSGSKHLIGGGSARGVTENHDTPKKEET